MLPTLPKGHEHDSACNMTLCTAAYNVYYAVQCIALLSKVAVWGKGGGVE